MTSSLKDLRARFGRERRAAQSPLDPLEWGKNEAGHNLGNFDGHHRDDPFCPGCEPDLAEVDDDARVWPKRCAICHGGVVHLFRGEQTLCDRCGSKDGSVKEGWGPDGTRKAARLRACANCGCRDVHMGGACGSWDVLAHGWCNCISYEPENPTDCPDCWHSASAHVAGDFSRGCAADKCFCPDTAAALCAICGHRRDDHWGHKCIANHRNCTCTGWMRVPKTWEEAKEPNTKGICTNCGNKHTSSSSLVSPCINGYSDAPGGSSRETCTHRGGHKSWCSFAKSECQNPHCGHSSSKHRGPSGGPCSTSGCLCASWYGPKLDRTAFEP